MYSTIQIVCDSLLYKALPESCVYHDRATIRHDVIFTAHSYTHNKVWKMCPLVGWGLSSVVLYYSSACTTDLWILAVNATCAVEPRYLRNSLDFSVYTTGLLHCILTHTFTVHSGTLRIFLTFGRLNKQTTFGCPKHPVCVHYKPWNQVTSLIRTLSSVPRNLDYKDSTSMMIEGFHIESQKVFISSNRRILIVSI